MQDENIIHIIDPDWAIGEALGALLGTYGIAVRIFPDAESYLAFFAANEVKPRCVLIETELPGMTGLSLLRRLRDEQVEVPIIVLTSSQRPNVHQQAQQLGATEVVQKPLLNGFSLERLAQILPSVPKRTDIKSEILKRKR
ncbi:MAG: response regulator [Planctomycetales bacterium]|nr:response regulator [Planctomycetales bacterium]